MKDTSSRALAHAQPDAPVRVTIQQAAPDRIVPLAVLAAEWHIEVAGLRAYVVRTGVPVVRIGRASCVRVSDVLAAVEAVPLSAANDAATQNDPRDGATLQRRAGGRLR